MGPVAIIAGIGLAVSAYGTYSSIKNQKKARREQKKANAAQRAQDNMKAARERREAIRNARIASANSLQGSVNTGVESSSGALGALGSIEQQLNQGLSFLDQFNTLSDQAGRNISKANDYSSKAADSKAIGQFGQQVFSNASGISSTVFGKGS